MAITLNGTTGITTPALDTSGDVTFADNDKAVFGAGSDLQIYHDSNDSYVKDNGTGNLLLQGTNLNLQSTTAEDYIRCTAEAQVELYHNNAQKLATTATGVTVTGNVDTSGTILVGNTNSVFAENNLKFNSGGASYIDHATVGQAINFRVSNASSLDTTAMTISSTGVISGDGSGLTGVGGSTALGAVGTWGMLGNSGAGVNYFTAYYSPGGTIAGSGLKYVKPNGNVAGSAQSGTWRLMNGGVDAYTVSANNSLWVRIS